MKKIVFIVVLLSTTFVFSQKKTFEKEVKKISKKIEKINKQQKDSLKIKIKKINIRLDNKEITKEEAQKLKKLAASYHAANIERLVGAQEQKLQQLVQDKVSGKLTSIDEDYEENTFSIGGVKFKVKFDEEESQKREKRRKKRKYKNKRTTSQIVFAMGVNNVLTNNQFSSLNNSEYKFWQSRFYEVGFTFKTRFSKDVGKLYFKYGLSFLWNNLRPENNQYIVTNRNLTSLVVHPENLSENRFRHVQMTFPMHLELDFSKNKKYEDGRIKDNTNNSIRIGVGGFFGFNIGNRQFLEYTNSQSLEVEEIQKGSFNINRLNYGISTYVGYKDMSLYVKYDMNPLFKDTEIRNISLGFRFDWD